MLRRIEDDERFLTTILFFDEAYFHISGTVNRHNVRIWGSESPHEYREMTRGCTKVNVWCALMHVRVIGPLFFAEMTVTSDTYLDMLQNFVFPQVEALQPEINFQPHWSTIVRDALEKHFPGRWTGRGGPISWPPRSPDITPLDCFLCGYVKDVVYKTQVRDIDQLETRIRDAIATVVAGMLARTWQEIEYRFDILRATNGANLQLYQQQTQNFLSFSIQQCNQFIFIFVIFRIIKDQNVSDLL
ncbi:hypothetical protein B7P43_G00793 [Cryptotermes secundus]|uniref:Tc1-like transposase DDE domain-containing protein n=1 Tax=Cryptotermes secundus TaxID=105785 RepID=A0A2J7QSL8_9NEOP|nr:hypothetical protein B7P43_G00793 [Cryptotermes secundus]